MRRTLKSFFTNEEITDLWFAEDDEDDEEVDEDESEDEDDDSEEEDDDDSEDDEEDDEEDQKGKKKSSKKDEDDDNEALMGALRKERKLRKQHERENKALRAQLAKRTPAKKSSTPSDDGKAQREAEERDRKSERLAESLRIQAEDRVITKHARKLGFRDEEIAVKLLDRDDLDVEQDDDDPTKVKVDERSAERAVKRLAKQQPFLLKPQKDENDDDEGEEDDEENSESRPRKSASKFKGKKKSGKTIDEKQLAGTYAALGNRRRKVGA